jgi:DNA-binding NtrC family response regulator
MLSSSDISLDVRAYLAISRLLLTNRTSGWHPGEMRTALGVAQSIPDPTFRCECLIDAMNSVVAHGVGDMKARSWLESALSTLSRDAAMTDSRAIQEALVELSDRVAAKPGREVENHGAVEGIPVTDQEVADTAVAITEPLLRENQALRAMVAASGRDVEAVPELIGAEEAHLLLRKSASNSSPVLIAGEEGTGRLRMALIAHEREGLRGLFLPIPCGVRPDWVAQDSGPFGSLRSALQIARGGTLILQDVHLLSQSSIDRLYDSIRAGDARSVGDTWLVSTIRVDPRTSEGARTRRLRRLLKLIDAPVTLPPLRQRFEHLRLLVELLVAETCSADSASPPVVSDSFLRRCRRYDWPRNVAELRTAICRAATLARDGEISDTAIPSEDFAMLPYREAELDFDHRVLTRALRATGGNARAAAQLLDLPLSTLRYKLRRIELDPDEPFRR